MTEVAQHRKMKLQHIQNTRTIVAKTKRHKIYCQIAAEEKIFLQSGFTDCKKLQVLCLQNKKS